MYYSGMDTVDINDQWFSERIGAIFCPECQGVMHPEKKCPDFIVEQRIPKNIDMFFMSMCNHVGVMSLKFKNILGEFSGNLNFGKIHVFNKMHDEVTHFAYTGKTPQVMIRGALPALMDGLPVLDSDERRYCNVCGRKFHFERGARFIYDDEIPEVNISWTQFAGILFNSNVYDLLQGYKFRGIRLEKIEIKNRLS